MPAEAGSGTGAQRRVFFAIWPEAGVAGALASAAEAAARRCGGRRMRQETLHVTLAFIGAVSETQVAELQAIGAAVRAPRFELALDQTGWWRHNHIVWAGASVLPPALERLVRDLNGALRAAGYRLDHRPFAAHVTLLRKAQCSQDPPRLPSLAWPVAEFVLVESVLKPEGADYRPLAHFPLQE